MLWNHFGSFPHHWHLQVHPHYQHLTHPPHYWGVHFSTSCGGPLIPADAGVRCTVVQTILTKWTAALVERYFLLLFVLLPWLSAMLGEQEVLCTQLSHLPFSFGSDGALLVSITVVMKEEEFSLNRNCQEKMICSAWEKHGLQGCVRMLLAPWNELTQPSVPSLPIPIVRNIKLKSRSLRDAAVADGSQNVTTVHF